MCQEANTKDQAPYFENLGDDVVSFTVRVARVQPSAGHANGNANSHANEQPVFEQTLEKPEYGWPSEGAFVSFPDLLTGWQYQVSLTIQTMVGSLPILGPRTVTVEEGSVSVPRTATSPHAWTMHRWVAEDGSAQSPTVINALSVGWRNVAPNGSGLYTLTAMNNGQRAPLTTGPVSGESVLILGGSTWYDWCAHAAPPPQDITISDIGGGGTTGIIPPRPDPDLCVDPVTGVSYTYTWSTYATDHLGTVRAVVSDAPNNVTTVKRFDYEPFGVELPNPDNIGCSNTHKYTGHERDQETGNDYMHFRYFSASMGRFQKPDSVFDGASRNPQGFNLYSYVSGNPVNFNDPTGHIYITPALAKMVAAWMEWHSQWMSVIPAGATPVGTQPGAGTSGGDVGGTYQAGGGSGASYNLLIVVQNFTGTDLTAPQQKNLIEELKAPFANTQITVNITFDGAAQGPDGTVVKYLNIWPSYDVRVKTIGPAAGGIETDAGGSAGIGHTDAHLYLDIIQKKSDITRDSDYLGRALGRGGAHEIGHTLGLKDSKDLELNIMRNQKTDKNWWIGPGGGFDHRFSKKDIADMIAFSWEKRK